MGRRISPRALLAPVLSTMLLGAWAAPALAASDPSANREPSAATVSACNQAPSSLACDVAALNDINAARAAEGVGPMILPHNYESLTQPQQLLVIANLERTGRGLIPAQGLSASLNAAATAGALANVDPNPSSINGDVMASNWAGGIASPLLVDFMWMYDDGVGSYNLDCNAPSDSGCWGHRDNILYPFDPPLAFGAAELTTPQWGSSVTEVFVGGDLAIAPNAADALVGPSWNAISQSLQPVLSSTSVVLGGGSNSGQLTLSAPSQDISVQLSTSSGWQVSPTSCQLSAGSSCQLTLTQTSPGASGGKLTITGPAGNNTVPLSGAVVPHRVAAPAHKPAHRPAVNRRHRARAARVAHPRRHH